MRIFLIACLTAAVVATLGALALDHYQKSADVAYADPATVRL